MSAVDSKNRMMLKPGTLAELSGGGGGVGGPIKEEVGGIDQSLLERRLEGLRDTQESVQGLSLWCQANKRHSTPIIESWLKILKKSPVEKRLTLFYLVNDVVQHAKRKNDTGVVNQWAVAVQKATPLVRTPSSVSTAIARIFRIWEERSVYNKDTIADLLALLNNVPAKERVAEKKKPETYTASAEKVAAFQSSVLISKIKVAYKLKSHLGVTFRAKPFVYMDMDTLKGSIKDRSHGMEVVQEIGQLLEQLKTSEQKLLIEVEERRKIVEMAEIAIVQYENVRGEAKIVNSAYKNFTERVEATRDNVIEKCKSFEEMDIDSSPVPSPPREAPSPPDEDDFGVQSASSSAIRKDIAKAPGSSGGNTTAIPNLAAMHQQYHQAGWSQNQAAAMSAVFQHMLPGSNPFLAMQQAAGGSYKAQQGYESYQEPPVPDVSSIPLPPTPASSASEPVSQTMTREQSSSLNHVPPIDPYSTYSYGPSSSMSTSTTDYSASFYTSTPQQDVLNSSFGSDYGVYSNLAQTTPTGGVYQSYSGVNEHDGTSGISNQHHSMQVSPSYSNHPTSVPFAGGNTPLAPNQQGVQSSFDPMQMFSASLNKTRGSISNSQSSDGASTLTPNSETSPGQTYGQPEPGNYFCPGIYGSYDASGSSTNGAAIEPYSPRKPGMGDFGYQRGRGANRGTPRGSGRPPRGRGGPRGRGMRGGAGNPSSNPRGFFRGRGTTRGVAHNPDGF